jgi:LysR family transcriptional regulator, regulator for bpeEF and oprC
MTFVRQSNMKSIQQFIAFASTAKHRSFSVAARELALTPSTVAKSVARLEASLGVKLFHRTTRQVRLTPDGEALYHRCVDILEQVEALETTAAATRGEPAGVLTLDAPEFYGRRVVLPVVMSLLSTYPELRADVRLSDSLSDVIADGLDAVIRIGALNDSSLMARQFDVQQLVTCASPAYLARHGVPRSVDSLASHQCLVFRLPSSGRERVWQFLVDGEAVDWHPPTRLRLSNGEAIVDAAVRGGGIAQVPDNMVEEGLADGSLVEVLSLLRPPPLPISIVTPENRLMSSRVRVLIDALVADRRSHASKPSLRRA